MLLFDTEVQYLQATDFEWNAADVLFCLLQ